MASVNKVMLLGDGVREGISHLPGPSRKAPKRPPVQLASRTEGL